MCFFSARSMVIGALACSLSVFGCNGTIEASVETHARVHVSTSADLSRVVAGDAVPLTLDAEGVFLVEPAATVPAAHVADAGHFQVYLDTTANSPLLVTASVDTSVTIPAATEPGPHRVVCRVHRHDGTPTTTQLVLNITVVPSLN